MPLTAHEQCSSRWTSVDCGSSATSSESGAPVRGEQLEQVAERRHRVVGGQEAREHVAAARGAREDHALLRRLVASAGSDACVRTTDSDSPTIQSTWLVTLTGTAMRPAPAAPDEQAQVEQQHLLLRHLLPRLVHEVEPLAGSVEDDAELGADRGDQPPRLVERLAVGERPRGGVRGERMRGHRLHAERPEHEREHGRRRRGAVVDDDAEARARGSRRASSVESSASA